MRSHARLVTGPLCGRRSAVSAHRARRAGLLALVLAVGACGLPRDPNGTLDRVRGDTLHVGLSEAPPFVVRAGESDEPLGVEAALVRAFADSLGAAVAWHWGPSTDHAEALSAFELDVGIGGIRAGSSLANEVGATQPYYRGHEAIGAPPGTPPPEDWDGIPIAVPAGDALAARVEAEGAVPVRLGHPARTSGFVAAPDWRLRASGRRPVKDLGPAEYVVLTPPGENGLIHALDRFLAARESRIRAALGAAREDR